MSPGLTSPLFTPVLSKHLTNSWIIHRIPSPRTLPLADRHWQQMRSKFCSKLTPRCSFFPINRPWDDCWVGGFSVISVTPPWSHFWIILNFSWIFFEEVIQKWCFGFVKFWVSDLYRFLKFNIVSYWKPNIAIIWKTSDRRGKWSEISGLGSEYSVFTGSFWQLSG